VRQFLLLYKPDWTQTRPKPLNEVASVAAKKEIIRCLLLPPLLRPHYPH
jgi:hypothetical protein